jgi:6-phosphogluconolactonase
MTALLKHHEHRFPDTHALMRALSGEIQVDLAEAIAARAVASLVVSGGNTPGALFDELARESIDWSRVWITLSDERWVDATSDTSNEYLVRTRLLKANASVAHFIGLKNPAPTPEAGVEWASRALTRMSRPYDVVVLGMGNDGHIASLFSGSLGLARALDSRAAPTCVAMNALAPPHARISQNLAALMDSRRIVLLITGEEKWAVYQRAKNPGSSSELPVRAILHQHTTPIDVYWSP